MALKTVVSSLSEVPDAMKGEYEAYDGKFRLKLEGDVPGFVKASDLADANGRVVEFRDRNIALLKALGAERPEDAIALIEKLKAVDPAEYAKLKEKMAGLEKKGVKSGDDVDARFKEMLEAAIAPLKADLAKSESARNEAQGRADDATLRQSIGEKFIKAGGKPAALDFIVTQARGSFRVVNGEVRAQDGKYSATNPGNTLGVDEWLAGMVKTHDYAFAPSNGGGAAGGSGTSTSVAPRPGVRQITNPTPQELGRMKYVPGKGMVDENGQQVEIVKAA
jgi:hypothetical protein